MAAGDSEIFLNVGDCLGFIPFPVRTQQVPFSEMEMMYPWALKSKQIEITLSTVSTQMWAAYVLL